MKKIFFILSLFISGFAFSQPGYTNINSRYNWIAGIFRALGLPSGDSAQFTAGQSQRQGAVYMDTVNTPLSPNGYYIYEDPTGGNAPFWNLQRNDQICQNRLISEWSVSWQGVGFNFSVHGGLTNGQGTYQIGCSFYTADSATVTFAAADPDDDRIDIIFLDATGVQTRQGELSAPGTAVRPTVDADEILLTEVLVAAGATSPTTLTQLIVYNENTESVVSNVNTTTNGANTTFVFTGSLSTNVTNINHNDQVFFTKLPDLSTWNVLGYDGLSIALHLKATMPTDASLAVALQVGTTTVGAEVIVPLVKTNSTTYQQLTIPLSAFGNIINTSITRVRFRYIRQGNNTVFSGFYLDYIYFIDGLGNSTPQQAAQFTLNMPGAFTVIPTNSATSPGVWNVLGAGNAGQYITGAGQLATFPTLLTDIGTLNGRAKTADGGEIDGDEFFFQTVDATFPGLMTSAMFTKLDSNYYITNSGDGDTLAWPLAVNITAIKSLKGTGGITISSTDTTVIIDGSGGGSESTTASNGLTEVGDDVQLGGTLTGNVTIGTGAFGLTVSTATGGVRPFAVASTTGDGMLITSTSGTGLSISASTSGTGLNATSGTGLPAVFSALPASTNSVHELLRFNRLTSGTAANGLGGTIDTYLENDAGTAILAGQLIIQYSDVTNGSEDSHYDVMNLINGTPTVTTFSPHNFTGIPEGRSEEFAWSFYSERAGKYINVDMLKLARLVERLTGVKLVYIGTTDKKPNPQNK